MTPEELVVLVERAQGGDQAAFHDLVAHTIGDVRLFIASHVSTSVLGDAILTETYAAIRRELARCPKVEVSTWMCRAAATQLSVRLGDAMRGATTAKDPLIHLMMLSGSEALAQNLTGNNAAAAELPRRLLMQPPSLRQLLQRHYREGLTVATIAEKQGLAEADVAQALMTARARMDWSGVAEVGDTADKTFPRVVEDFLSGTLVPDMRSLLVAGVMQDPVRATQFERQVRLHLLLQVLLTPFDPTQLKEFIASLPRNDDSSRLVVAPRMANTTARTTNLRKPSSGPRPRDATRRTTRQPQETGGDSRAYVASSPATAEGKYFSEDAPSPAKRLPLLLGLGAAVIGLLVFIIVKSQSSMSVPTASPVTTQSVVVVGDPLIVGGDGKNPAVDVSSSPTTRIVNDQSTDSRGAFVRGINFGDGVVVIQKNQWFSLAEALSSGLTLGKGTRLGGPVQVSGAGLDFDSKRMLDVGLIGDGGQVEFTQAVPNGDWDLTMWIAGPSEVQFSRLALTAGGSPVELDLAATKAERYRRIGPYRLQIRNHVMDLRLSGMGNAHVAGMRLNAAGPLEGSMPPMIMITNPTADAEISSTNLAISVRSISDAGIAKVVFYNNDTLLGEATKSPFSFNWNGAVVGPFALTAVATDSTGVSSRSPTITGVVLDPSQLRGLTREMWHNIPKRTVSELRKRLASPPSKVDVVPHTNHALAGGNFGVRFRATLIPPSTGDYILEVVSDDQSEVWLSTDEDPVNRRLVCVVPSYVDVNQWTAYPSQRSQPIALIKDQRCFIEILYKQEAGAAHIILGWVRPDGVNERPIPASRFSPVPVTNALPPPRSTVPPTGGAVAQTAPVDPNTPIGPPGYIWCVNEGGRFTLSGTIDVAYGINGKFFFLYKQTGTILFVHETFGGDPVPGYPKAGFYKPLSGNTVAGAASAIPPVIPREMPQVPPGSFVQGTVAPSALVVNLSEQGSSDWIHYGVKDATSFVRHQGGSERLSVVRTVDNAPIGRYDDNQTLFSWNNGNAPTTSVAIKTGWYTENRGKGFSFIAPADPGLRRLMVWVGGRDTHGIFTATLSDGSAPVYRDDSINVGAERGFQCFTLWYRAKQPGAKLTISYSSDRATDGNITLQAAALTEYDEGKPRFIKAVNFGGKTVQVAGNQWLAQTTAESTDLVIHEGRRVSATGDPVPAVDAAMKEVLKTGVAGKAADLEINERVVNGRYDVTLYVMETGIANSRLFDVTMNDASLMGIGQLPKNGWAAYGPLTATVTKGVLSLTAKAKKGSPQIMGISIFSAGNGAWTNAFPAGRAHDVPGTLLFADFDRGANGVAFQEREPVQPNPIYRMEPVGIYSVQGVPTVAAVSDGEWLRFTINAKESGTYAVTVKYSKASGDSSRVEFEIDGKAVAKALSLEDTFGWDNSKTLTTIGFPLSAGVHDLRTLFHGPPLGVANFWSMEFVRTGP